MLRHVKQEVADLIVIRSEILVQLQSHQLDINGGELVVGEVQAGHVLVVLCVGREAGEGGESVVGEVEDCGPGW